MTMKKLTINFEGTTDTTGYLFSLTKCLSAALYHSEYSDFADDIIASSGFAFRMWIAPDLCPSGTSIWEFKMQKPWVENGGLLCNYTERLWDEDSVEEERRILAIKQIKASIDNNIAAVAWDISGCEWGAIIGYNDEEQLFYTLKINGSEDKIPYEKLGHLELPILSVLTVIGKKELSTKQLITNTKKLAVFHLLGNEYCDNPKGLPAYNTLISFISEKLTEDKLWNLEYYLGTYAALKWYAMKFFSKYKETSLSELYKTIYESWKRAFDLCSHCIADEKVKKEIIQLLENAKEQETKAVEIMSLEE